MVTIGGSCLVPGGWVGRGTDQSQLLPEKRLAVLRAALFGVKLARAIIARISHDCAARLKGFVATAQDRVVAAQVKLMDETGFRIGGWTQWLHIASTIWLTSYRVSPKRQPAGGRQKHCRA